ncbi:uncharacterized protein LTR77_003433 [Saxophila tyrrhenica]|uniref:Uncharacterized protein n=1 Tax=Saxophila tyrrhenica TaxID=1690608 RepID=A0AAV9PHU6_9PEZI|nr:hypothetical protein LTR77_003433 [Saxophila tyrrhenica]
MAEHLGQSASADPANTSSMRAHQSKTLEEVREALHQNKASQQRHQQRLKSLADELARILAAEDQLRKDRDEFEERKRFHQQIRSILETAFLVPMEQRAIPHEGLLRQESELDGRRRELDREGGLALDSEELLSLKGEILDGEKRELVAEERKLVAAEKGRLIEGSDETET